MNTLIVAIALAMDSFSVSICGGASLNKVQLKDSMLIGVYFGGFQCLMTLIGWKSGLTFSAIINSFDHWIALGLLLLIGTKMIIESFQKNCKSTFKFTHKALFALAIATSIDALGVGFSYALLDNRNAISSSLVIGITAFIFSAIGLYLGKCCKQILNKRAELIGGIILIFIGFQIAIDHGAFNF